MAVLKNPHNVIILVGGVPLKAGEQLTVHPPYSNAIADALDRGDVILVDDTLTPAERKADADALNPKR